MSKNIRDLYPVANQKAEDLFDKFLETFIKDAKLSLNLNGALI